MGRTRKTANASLGKALVKSKKSTLGDKSAHDERHNVHEEKTAALKSVTEESSYDEFIATATLAEKEFTAEKVNIKFVGLSVGGAGNPALDPAEYMTEAERKAVVVPRRPKWTTEMTAEELDSAEKDAFLNWRRGMAHLQNKQDITPFERNIEVWRQLWRVLERSDIIVQIVDARNPLLYRSEDLEVYVKELGKRNVILVNKADFLSENQRKYWAEFFKSVNLPYAFYSAASANEKLVDKDEIVRHKGQPGADIGAEESSSESESEESEEIEKASENKEEEINQKEEKKEISDYPVLSRTELINFLKSFKSDSSSEELFSVGLVGYPNVGKSSTINSLMGIKRTSVSATPGKTKHFQTLYLEPTLLLCDCPGLVMPAFGGSKGEMVLGGILPIDQLTEYGAASALLIQRIPKERLEKVYGIVLQDNYTHDDLLSSYAAIRGFMTVRGLPDSSRAARIILKDYVNGKLRFCKAPPSITQEEFLIGDENREPHFIVDDDDHQNEDERIMERAPRPPTLRTVNVEKRLDSNFFAPASSNIHYKGKHQVASGLTASSSSSNGSVDKPWRKHNNKNKREKLRRVYRHLDVE